MKERALLGVSGLLEGMGVVIEGWALLGYVTFIGGCWYCKRRGGGCAKGIFISIFSSKQSSVEMSETLRREDRKKSVCKHWFLHMRKTPFPLKYN